MNFEKKDVFAISEEELSYRQRLPLDIKVSMAKNRIREYVRVYGESGTYCSLSGGLDSTVLRHIIDQMYPGNNIENVYLDTWMEYPGVRRFVYDNFKVRTIKPSKDMKTIINQTGFCFPSKDVAEMIEGVRNNKKWAIKKINGLDKNGQPSKFREQYKKWWKLVDSHLLITARCCDEMKEKPVFLYEKETRKHPFLALRAEESQRRKTAYLKSGCNTFEGERPASRPIAFFTKNDILQYIVQNNVNFSEEYGDIVIKNEIPGQMSLCMDCERLCTTGESRTGCMFCPVMCHLNNFEKYRRLKKKYPKLYDYAMEELGIINLVEWCKKNLGKSQ